MKKLQMNEWKHARIGKQYSFSASHQLLKTGVKNHPCSRMHGHNYMVEVEVRGEVSPMTGFIVDFAFIDNTFKPLIKQLDHTHLNDTIENPTAENIAQWLMDNHTPHFVWSIKVWETNKCWAQVVNPDGLWKKQERIE